MTTTGRGRSLPLTTPGPACCPSGLSRTMDRASAEALARLLKAVADSNNGIIGAANIHLAQQADRQQSNTMHELPVEVIRQADDEKPTAASIAELEAEHIAKLLSSYNGHRRHVADTLGISERTLYRKLKRYNLA